MKCSLFGVCDFRCLPWYNQRSSSSTNAAASCSYIRLQIRYSSQEQVVEWGHKCRGWGTLTILYFIPLLYLYMIIQHMSTWVLYFKDAVFAPMYMGKFPVFVCMQMHIFALPRHTCLCQWIFMLVLPGLCSTFCLTLLDFDLPSSQLTSCQVPLCFCTARGTIH